MDPTQAFADVQAALDDARTKAKAEKDTSDALALAQAAEEKGKSDKAAAITNYRQKRIDLDKALDALLDELNGQPQEPPAA